MSREAKSQERRKAKKLQRDSMQFFNEPASQHPVRNFHAQKESKRKTKTSH